MESRNKGLRQVFNKDIVSVVDGALATEIEARGWTLHPTLWSAVGLMNWPDAIQQLHDDYLEAGADILTTASYQATFPGLQAYGLANDAQCEEVIRRSVQVAQQARHDFLKRNQTHSRPILIAGSVGPFGAYLANGSEYRGDYKASPDELKTFHRSRMRVLLDAGCDILACETLPSYAEINALIELLSEFPSAAAWFSFTLRDEARISDGTHLEVVLDILNKSKQVWAVGINCIPVGNVLAALKHLAGLTELPLIAYPNSGEVWDADQRKWISQPDCHTFSAALIDEWIGSGANIIGGCCRTNPATIQEIRRIISRSS